MYTRVALASHKFFLVQEGMEEGGAAPSSITVDLFVLRNPARFVTKCHTLPVMNLVRESLFLCKRNSDKRARGK